ncbi:MAG: dihydropteroate synthase [Anaerolineales bacterium]|nr:dihydropteroate synthase [Anaerolineales bacterium]
MPADLSIGNQTFRWGVRTYVMGILNITPDSFSGDGLMAAGVYSRDEMLNTILAQARHFVAAGVDILDVGGESTRPGSEPVGVTDELARVVPVVQALAEEFPQIPISIDTYKAAVAEAAIQAGARLVNDIWGLRADPELAQVVAAFEVPVILMHNRSQPANVEVRARLGAAYLGAEYEDLMADVCRELLESVALAHAAGIPDERILLDPGIGFGKTVSHNLELIDRLDGIRALGYPVLLGPSRKSFIGFTLDLPPDQRVEGTAATVAIGIARGADIVRVHDVQAMVRVARMTDALVRRGQEQGKGERG